MRAAGAALPAAARGAVRRRCNEAVSCGGGRRGGEQRHLPWRRGGGGGPARSGWTRL
jgi:hypothetical protein